MNPWAVTAIVVAGLAAYATIVQLCARSAAAATEPSRLETELLATITDHPTRNARRITQHDYAQLIVWELAQHGHTVAIVDVLDCLASSRLALKDDIDGAAVDAYYAAVLGDTAS